MSRVEQLRGELAALEAKLSAARRSLERREQSATVDRYRTHKARQQVARLTTRVNDKTKALAAAEYERENTDCETAAIDAALELAVSEVKALRPRIRVINAWMHPVNFDLYLTARREAGKPRHLSIANVSVRYWPSVHAGIEELIIGGSDRVRITVVHLPPAGTPLDTPSLTMYQQLRRSGADPISSGHAVTETLHISA